MRRDLSDVTPTTRDFRSRRPAAQVVSDVPCVQETVRLEPSPWIEILPTSIQRNVQIVAYAKTSAQLKSYRKKDPPQGGRFLTMKQTPREAPLIRLHINRKKDPPQGGRFLTMKQTPREAPLMRLHYNIVRRI